MLSMHTHIIYRNTILKIHDITSDIKNEFDIIISDEYFGVTNMTRKISIKNDDSYVIIITNDVFRFIENISDNKDTYYYIGGNSYNNGDVIESISEIIGTFIGDMK